MGDRAEQIEEVGTDARSEQEEEASSAGAGVESAGAEAPEQGSSPAAQAPWSDDLNQAFEDEEQRQAVDAFLREHVQPYVTRLEQQSSPNRAATQLYEDFTEKPVETFLAVSREIFGDEAAQAIYDTLRGVADDEESPELEDEIEAAEDDDNDDDEGLEGLPPAVREIVEEHQAQKRQEAYQAELDRLKADERYKDVTFHEDLFHPFVIAADGDFDVAAEGYVEFLKDWQEAHGLRVPSPDDVAEAETEAEESKPPPVSGGGTTPPPTQKKYEGATLSEAMDQALDDFLSEQSSSAPPVGST